MSLEVGNRHDLQRSRGVLERMRRISGLWVKLGGLTGVHTEDRVGGWGMGWEICASAPRDEGAMAPGS